MVSAPIAVTTVAAPVAEAPGSTSNNTPIATFSLWSQQYLAANASERAGLVAEGEALAIQRRAVLAALIQQDPQAALALAVPARLRRELPESITRHLEERVSGRGFLGVLIATDFEKEQQQVLREVILNHRRYEAWVYGPRLRQSTRDHVVLQGIAIGNRLAVDRDPVRPLEADETVPADALNNLCPVSSRPAGIHGTPAFAEVAGRIESFCGVQHLQLLNDRLAADAGGKGGGPSLIEDSWSQGPKTCLFMRVAFPDDPAEPITEDGAYALMDSVNVWYVENSYNTTQIIPTVTPLLMLPQPKAWYSVQGTGTLLSDAREAARLAGYDTDNFTWDIVRHSNVPGFTYGGLAYVHGKGVWLQSSSTGVACHELGHNYGLWHANFWAANGDSVIGPGTHVEYGNSYDTMGAANAGNNQFNAAFKNQLDWLPDSFVHNVTNSGTFRIYTYDVPSLTPGRSYAFKVRKNYDRNYWGEFRQKFANNRWFLNGIVLNWDPWDNGVANSAGGTHLLDTTPGTLNGKDDGGVVIGRTWSDVSAGVHITPIAKGNAGPEGWIDVVLNLDTFPGNHPPTLALSSDRSAAATGVAVNFTAVAADPDGDTLAYFWDFGDDTFGPNSDHVSKSWSSPGEYTVLATASDMKGGRQTRLLVITVGSPATYRASGRITTDQGAPLEGVRVHNGQSGANYRATYTDSDGNYVLANNIPGAHTLAAVKYGYALSHPGWLNPVTLGPSAVGLNWTAVADPVVSISVTDAICTETNLNPGAFTITRSGPVTSPLTVKFNRTGSATYTADYTNSPAPSGAPLQVTIPAGSNALTMLVLPVNDGFAEGPETIIVSLIEDAAYVLGPLAEARLVITDDEPPAKPTVDVSAINPSSADNLAPESGSDTAVFTFTRTGGVANELIINYAVSGTATPGLDYVPLSGVVSIPAGETVTAVPFLVLDDADVEGNETVIITIASNTVYNVAGGLTDTTTLTIVDDDPATVFITAIDDVAREAGASSGQFTVTRVGSLNANLVVHYSMGGSASNGVDYVSLPGVVTIPAGRVNATITVTPINDALLEGDETVTATLLSSPTVNVLSPGSATVVIVDDEFPSVTLAASDPTASEAGPDPGAFTFTRSGATTNPLTVHYSINGTATPGADYAPIPDNIVIPAGSATAILTILPFNDLIPESAEKVTLTLLPDPAYSLNTTTPQTVTINDNDAGLPGVGFTFATSSGPESETFVQLSVGLSASSVASVTVNYSVTGGSATGGGVDYSLANGTLTFSPGTINQSINLSIFNDSFVETNETIVVSLNSPTNAVLDAIPAHTYMILDDDGPGAVTVTAIDANASESGPDPGAFRIARSGSTAAPLTVFFQIAGTASSPSDYLPIGNSVIIPAGTAFVDVPVIPVDDNTPEITETVLLNLTLAPGAKLGFPDTATVQIADNDSGTNLPVVSVVATDPVAAEPGSDTGLFTISRDSLTNSDLLVVFSISGNAASGTDYNAISNFAVIPAGAFVTNIVVTAKDDAIFESNETVVVTLTLNDTYRVAPAAAAATVTILDNEAGVWVTSIGNAAEDGSSTGYFAFNRAGSTESNLTVNFVVSGTASSGLDFDPLGTNVVIPAGTNSVLLPVHALDDAVPEGSETIIVTLSASAAYARVAPTNATLVILDDEPAVSVAATIPTALESGPGAGQFTVTRTGNTNSAVTIHLSFTGTASNGVDYMLLTNVVSILAGQTEATIAVVPLDDAATEGDETVQLQLLPGPAYAVLAPSNAVVTLIDDELNFPPVATITSPVTDTVSLLNTNSLLVLEATVTDDGRPVPPGAVTVSWSSAGPGPVTFGPSNAVNTTARFATNGSYLLTLSAFDGFAQGTDAVMVVVGPDLSPSAGLMAYWKFNETNGATAFDSSTNARHATVNGAIPAPGRFDSALNFDGADDTATFDSPALTQWTVSAWIRSDTTGDSFLPRVLAMPGYNIRIRRDPNTVALESIRATTSGEWRTPGNMVFDGFWYHIVVAYDSSSTGNAPQFYINGVPQPVTLRTAPSGAQAANTGTGYIGNAAGLNNSWDGLLDEMRLYNRVLSAAEIQNLAAGPVTNSAPIVDAGPQPSATTGLPIFMNAIVTDDGKPAPPGALALHWSKLSGPGTVDFDDEQSLLTSATFSASGIYVLRLTASDGQVKTADDLIVTVSDPITVSIRSPISNLFEFPALSGLVILTRTGDKSAALPVALTFGGSASNGIDYLAVTNVMTLAANAASGSFNLIPLADDLAEGDETITVTVLPDVSYVVGVTNTATLILHDRPWDAWRFANFTANELTNAAISSALADPDADQLSNLLEYSANLNPHLANTNRAFTAEFEMSPLDNKAYLVLTHRRRLGQQSDVSCDIYVSNDLVSWNSGRGIL